MTTLLPQCHFSYNKIVFRVNILAESTSLLFELLQLIQTKQSTTIETVLKNVPASTAGRFQKFVEAHGTQGAQEAVMNGE